MNTTSNPVTAKASRANRIILASAYRHERHSASRQKQARKTLHKVGSDDYETRDTHRQHHISSADETLDD
jgi:hypothetical protein